MLKHGTIVLFVVSKTERTAYSSPAFLSWQSPSEHYYMFDTALTPAKGLSCLWKSHSAEEGPVQPCRACEHGSGLQALASGEALDQDSCRCLVDQLVQAGGCPDLQHRSGLICLAMVSCPMENLM